MYKIIRFYRDGRRKTVKTVSTLEIAQLHCNDPRTKKTDSEGNTIYFDGYTEA